MGIEGSKILIVDDAVFNIRIVTKILEDAGYDIYTAKSGVRAILEVKKNKIDLILLDVMMPEVDGYQVNKILKQNKDTKDIPIIFLTARGDSVSLVKAFEDGAVDYVTKPFNEKELLSRIKIHLELQRTRKKLKESNSTKDKFLSIIGHDLKNPIGVVKGLADELVQNINELDRDEIKEFSKRILRNSDKVCQLLQDILEWARVQSDKIEYKPTMLNLREVVNESVKLLLLNARKKHINIIVLIEDDIEVCADFNMLNTVMRNLISNAIKFTYKNGDILITVDVEVDYCKISVKDTGVGIKEENIKKLFSIDSNFTTRGTQNEEGTGLGLILCKEFVERNGGSIFIESEYGKGSCVLFTIPKYRVNKHG
ncbi:sensor histidine kinase RcsC [Clostridium puniceum]|uniref:Stage 0 sporulation protein A homolog n=1 Tax=Clostridium puniceum TaxID=29367 RepID=A0A1S8TJA4_9CLOT|nr:hybrid sensor histidine kinase/response regulator [Clostridium puniceum]OOM77756.1 sensor histidine kinase RcsC [Clostridium puniceum]